MRRRPALLIPLVLLLATACVSVRADGRPARPPATTSAAVAPSEGTAGADPAGSEQQNSSSIRAAGGAATKR
ncbi:hypothetical protein [Streptomyces sp. NPDC015125]|uniref:hypothetical protein n=1 Tax=Streptomyces sp. NPDC015125 TaxID=3364938 RepID=UPI003701C9F6